MGEDYGIRLRFSSLAKSLNCKWISSGISQWAIIQAGIWTSAGIRPCRVCYLQQILLSTKVTRGGGKQSQGCLSAARGGRFDNPARQHITLPLGPHLAESSRRFNMPLRDYLYLAPGDSLRRPHSTRRRRSKSPERRRRRSRDYHSDNEATRHDRPDERERGLRPVRTRSNERASRFSRVSRKQVPSPTRIDRTSFNRVPSPPRPSFPYTVPPPPPVPYAMPPPPPISDMVPKGNPQASEPRRASPPPPLPVIIERVPSPPPPVMAPALPDPPSVPVRPPPPPSNNRHSYPWAHVSSSEDDEIKPEESASRPRCASPPLPPQLPPSEVRFHSTDKQVLSLPPSKHVSSERMPSPQRLTDHPTSDKRVPSPQRPTRHRPTRRSDPVLLLRHPPTLNKLVSAPRRPSPPPVIDVDPSSIRRESSNRTTPTNTPQVRHCSPSSSNRPSVVKQTPSPPPDDCRKSFPATPEAHTSITPSKGYRPMSLQVPFPISGGFPTPPDTVRPDDSRSVASQPTSEMRPWSRSAGSLALSGSMSRPPPPSPSLSSGILGIKTYQYAPLREMEFRLVRILPARSSKIKCEIIHASIEDAPEFISISYAWGDA